MGMLSYMDNATKLLEVTEQKTCMSCMYMYMYVVIQNWLLVQHERLIQVSC